MVDFLQRTWFDLAKSKLLICLVNHYLMVHIPLKIDSLPH